MDYGYMRGSGAGQNGVGQLLAMRGRGVPEGRIYMDRQSGKDFERPQYKRLLRRL